MSVGFSHNNRMTMRVIQAHCEASWAQISFCFEVFGDEQAQDGCAKCCFYRLVSISSACDSHTEDNTSPVVSRKASFFSAFSTSEMVCLEPGLTVMSSASTSLYCPAESLWKTTFSRFFISGSGQYRYSYRPAARMAPRIGPTQYTCHKKQSKHS